MAECNTPPPPLFTPVAIILQNNRRTNVQAYDSHSLNGDNVLFPCQVMLSRSKIKPKSAPAGLSCLYVLCTHVCFGASESFYSTPFTRQGRRLSSVTQTANLSKSVSPSEPTRADRFVSTAPTCFTATLVCISVSAISVALFLHAAAYFYTGDAIIHASDGGFEGSF